ncbi:MAG TPA: hypothetical protein DEF51_16100 [Myxococcales bacterium]|nr:hypothetical protein [Myxococcales bacterium]
MSAFQPPRDPKLASTMVLPACDPTGASSGFTAPGQDFADTVLDRPVIDLDALRAAEPQSHRGVIVFLVLTLGATGLLFLAALAAGLALHFS